MAAKVLSDIDPKNILQDPGPACFCDPGCGGGDDDWQKHLDDLGKIYRDIWDGMRRDISKDGDNMTTPERPITVWMRTAHGPRAWWAGTSPVDGIHAQLFGPWQNENHWRVETYGLSGGRSVHRYDSLESAKACIKNFFGLEVVYEERA